MIFASDGDEEDDSIAIFQAIDRSDAGSFQWIYFFKSIIDRSKHASCGAWVDRSKCDIDRDDESRRRNANHRRRCLGISCYLWCISDLDWMQYFFKNVQGNMEIISFLLQSKADCYLTGFFRFIENLSVEWKTKQNKDRNGWTALHAVKFFWLLRKKTIILLVNQNFYFPGMFCKVWRDCVALTEGNARRCRCQERYSAFWKTNEFCNSILSFDRRGWQYAAALLLAQQSRSSTL